MSGYVVVTHWPTAPRLEPGLLLPGHVLIVSGGKHLMLKRSGAHYYAQVIVACWRTALLSASEIAGAILSWSKATQQRRR